MMMIHSTAESSRAELIIKLAKRVLVLVQLPRYRVKKFKSIREKLKASEIAMKNLLVVGQSWQNAAYGESL